MIKMEKEDEEKIKALTQKDAASLLIRLLKSWNKTSAAEVNNGKKGLR